MMQNGVQYASTRLSDLINMMKKNKLLRCAHECCFKVPYEALAQAVRDLYIRYQKTRRSVFEIFHRYHLSYNVQLY